MGFYVDRPSRTTIGLSQNRNDLYRSIIFNRSVNRLAALPTQTHLFFSFARTCTTDVSSVSVVHVHKWLINNDLDMREESRF